MSSQSIFDAVNNIHLETVRERLNNIPNGSPHLYHYTSLESARLILETGKLRFTNMMYLNDPNEIREGLSIARKVLWCRIEQWIENDKQHIAQLLAAPFLHLLISLTSRSDRNSQRQELLQQYTAWFGEDVTKSYEPFWSRDWQIYICCLSERNDSLRQWIPYGDNGRGVAIGFKGVSADGHFIGDNPIIKVSYASNERKERYLNAVLDKLFDFYDNVVQMEMAQYQGDISKSPISAFLVAITDAIIQDIVACKNSHYADEQEWRMYYFRDSELLDRDEPSHPDFYINNGIMKPYYDFDYEGSALVDIKLGPQANYDLNRNSLDLLLDKKELVECKISQSEAQYRG